MGRGGGCAPGKLAFGKKGKAVDPGVGSQQDVAQPMDEANEGVVPQAAHDETVSGGGGGVAAADAAAVTPKATTTTTTTAPNLKLFVVYYSTYGHVAALAQKVKEGADSVEGVEGDLYQVPETLSDDVLSKMSAPTKDSSVPIISAQELTEADAIIFGFPTRYGSMAAQMKAFFDSTGNLWRGQSLAGKPAGFFFSTGTQGGGQETTAWTAITQLAHHGMLFVPIGYTFGAGMFKMDEIRGGSPYGAGTYAGDGSRTPNETELAMAVHQGRYTAGIVKGISGQGLSKA